MAYSPPFYGQTSEANVLVQTWDKVGAPHDVIQDASVMVNQFPLNQQDSWGGGEREIRVPIQLGPGGNAGTNLGLVESTPGRSVKKQYQITPGWVSARRGRHILDTWIQAQAGARIGPNVIASINRDAAGGVMWSLSAAAYNGLGVNRPLAKIRAGGISGDEIAITNPAAAIAFQEGSDATATDGDKLRLVTAAGVVQPGEIHLTARNQKTGVLGFAETITTAIPTAVAGMYLVRHVDTGTDALPPNGFFQYFPLTETLRRGTIFNVDGSTNSLLGGQGITVQSGSQSPVEIFAEFIRVMTEISGKPNMIMIRPAELAVWQLELADFIIETQNRAGDPSEYRLGFSGLMLRAPWGPLEVHPDPWLYDNEIDVAGGAADRTCTFTRREDWNTKTLHPLGWLTDDTKASFQRAVGAEVSEGTFLWAGQKYPRTPKNSGVWSTRASL